MQVELSDIRSGLRYCEQAGWTDGMSWADYIIHGFTAQ